MLTSTRNSVPKNSVPQIFTCAMNANYHIRKPMQIAKFKCKIDSQPTVRLSGIRLKAIIAPILMLVRHSLTASMKPEMPLPAVGIMNAAWISLVIASSRSSFCHQLSMKVGLQGVTFSISHSSLSSIVSAANHPRTRLYGSPGMAAGCVRRPAYCAARLSGLHCHITSRRLDTHVAATQYWYH